ncbi:MAG: hypothetical protein ACT4PM_05030 [Gemmatimonadales bacterium]
MSELVRFLYPLPARSRKPFAILQWWEERRLAYNLIVGATGCATIVLATFLSALVGRPPRPAVLLLGSALYGFCANLCYCLGPIAEISLQRFLGEDAPRAGPVLFRQGLIFSVGLTLFPVLLTGLWAAARMLNYFVFRW